MGISQRRRAVYISREPRIYCAHFHIIILSLFWYKYISPAAFSLSRNLLSRCKLGHCTKIHQALVSGISPLYILDHLSAIKRHVVVSFGLEKSALIYIIVVYGLLQQRGSAKSWPRRRRRENACPLVTQTHMGKSRRAFDRNARGV